LQILSKGNIVSSDTVTSSNPRSDHEFKLTFTEAMAQLLMPRARLVTWAVTGTGEMISDSLEVNVAASFSNKVSVTLTRLNTLVYF
jgi:Alpha-2-macroglobulin bait region domain